MAAGVTAADLVRLGEPFAPQDVEWRIQQAGDKNGKPWAKVLAYITNRAIMQRLDDVCTPGLWRNRFVPGAAGGVMCGIAVLCAREGPSAPRVPQWVWKYDAAENTDVEPVKGGMSGAMKRAAVQWGIGRYLYDLDEGWAKVHDFGRFSAKAKDGSWFKWDPPELPKWAQPAPAAAAPAPPITPAQTGQIEAALALLPNPKDRDRVLARVAEGLTRDTAAKLLQWMQQRLPAPATAGA